MEKIIVLALLTIAGVTAAVVVMSNIITSSSASSQSVAEIQQDTAVRIKTDIEVLAVGVRPGGAQVDAWVKNVGPAPITAIEKSNLFLIQPGTRFDALTYNNDGVTSKTWYADLKETGRTWNRSDTLHIIITMSGVDIIDGPEDFVLRMSTPNGIINDEIFGSYPPTPTPAPTPTPTPTPTPVPSNPVTLLDSWVGDGTYTVQDLNFVTSAGSNRLVVIAVTAEKNASGPLDVDQVKLGDALLVEIDQQVVGLSTAYHNIVWLGYLNEAGITGRTGDTITVAWTNAPNDPFGEQKVAAATYQYVDQSTPIADSSGATNAASSTLQPGSVTVGDGDRLVYGAVAGQPETHSAPGGYTEQIEFVGPVNDHSLAAADRDTTTSSTENPTATWSGSTRLGVIAAVLKNE